MSNLKIYRRIPLVDPRDGIRLYLYKSDIALALATTYYPEIITVGLVIEALAILAMNLLYPSSATHSSIWPRAELAAKSAALLTIIAHERYSPM